VKHNPKKFSAEIDAFIDRYVTDLRRGTAAVFAGAGLSVSSGYVNWAELLRGIAAELWMSTAKRIWSR